jgi:2-polyprenyl-6-methoxyphenol hydroxylase-like FAD-dependent oxidoreductase
MSPLRVLIIGGGIGGSAAALAMLRAGHKVSVFEQVKAKSEVGAGIQISPNASRLLHRYGLSSRLDEVAVRPQAVEARRWNDGKVLAGEPLGETVEAAFGAPHYHIHRADLLKVITDAIPQESLHEGKRCIGIVDDGKCVLAKFDDGSSAEGDVLVGADGIHSYVQKHLFGDEAPRFSGNIAFRGLVPRDRVRHLDLKLNTTNWMGPGGHFIHYFVSSGRYLNFVAVSEQSEWRGESWNDRADVGEAISRYSGWNSQIYEILQASERIFKWALFDRAPLPKWTKGRVTLLGDACHPMLPYMAQGAAQAIEDGATLARCLAEESVDTEGALERYETIRIPRTSRVQAMARRNATVFHLHDGPEQQERDSKMALRREKTKARAPAGRGEIFAHDAECLR